jgi:predicted Ser/Thr protein kinase
MEHLCVQAQEVIVGDCLAAASPDVRAHVAECAECGFLAGLSRDLGGSSGSFASIDDGPVGAFKALLDRAIETHEPLKGRYRIQQYVGRGGQGVVYRAEDLETREIVALKIVRCHPHDPSQSSREVVHAHQVRHPGVCRIDYTERHGDVRLIVMEFIEGETLAKAMDSLPPHRRLEVFRAVTDAVHSAHHVGILHLDLKPENVLIRTDGRPVVTDFGLSLSLSEDGSLVADGGTTTYMAPEQRTGKAVDRRTDVYALGRILAELAVPTRRAKRVARKATHEAPAGRYASVAAMTRALEPTRLPRGPALLGSAALMAGLLTLLLNPPAGARARWYPELWGPDPLPPNAWNVALNLEGNPLPSVVASERAVACARRLGDLLDGYAQYRDWEHGYAFPGAFALCVSWESLGHCGGMRDDASLCLKPLMRSAPFERLPLTGKEWRHVRAPERARLGQIEEASDCNRDYQLTVTLDRPRVIFAVRAWYHTFIPRRYAISVQDASGAWHTAFQTDENLKGIAHPPANYPTGAGLNAVSFPITTEFTPVRTQRVRLSVRCDLRNPLVPERPGEPAWLYELEVFSRVHAARAWAQHVLGLR